MRFVGWVLRKLKSTTFFALVLLLKIFFLGIQVLVFGYLWVVLVGSPVLVFCSVIDSLCDEVELLALAVRIVLILIVAVSTFFLVGRLVEPMGEVQERLSLMIESPSDVMCTCCDVCQGSGKLSQPDRLWSWRVALRLSTQTCR